MWMKKNLLLEKEYYEKEGNTYMKDTYDIDVQLGLE